MKNFVIFEDRDAMDTYLDGGVVDSREILYEKDTQTLVLGTNNDGEEYGQLEFKISGDDPEPVDNVYEDIFYNTCTEFTFPDDVTSVPVYAFVEKNALEVVDLNNVTSIGDHAFYNCLNLTDINLENVTSIEGYAFFHCPKLTSLDLPICETIGDEVFCSCNSLTTASLPVCTVVNYNAFGACHNLTSVSIPNCKTVASQAFYDCPGLTSIDLPACEYIEGYAFGENYNIEVYDFGNTLTSVPTVESDSLCGTDDFKIVVPDALVDDWKVAENWSEYASHIIGYSEYHNS